MREGEVGTFRALFSRPAAFDPYKQSLWSIDMKTKLVQHVHVVKYYLALVGSCSLLIKNVKCF